MQWSFLMTEICWIHTQMYFISRYLGVSIYTNKGLKDLCQLVRYGI